MPKQVRDNIHYKTQWKKVISPDNNGQLVKHLLKDCASCRRAVKTLNLPRSNYPQKASCQNNDAVIEEPRGLAGKNQLTGPWLCYYRLRRKGSTWTVKTLTGRFGAQNKYPETKL